ncbi:MAG: hypothetical protein V1816_13495 [Pseudomonadota bacterium]
MTEESKPQCFGELERVFPMGKDRLRTVRDSCAACPQVQSCLKAAVNTPAGLEMRVRRLEEFGRSGSTGEGVLGFFKRWSELKTLRTGSKGPGSARGKK